MKIKYLVYGILIVSFGGFISYRIIENKGAEADNNKSGKAKVMRLAGIVVQPETFDNILSLSGSIEANEQVEIRSEVSGLVESINFKREVTLVRTFKVNDRELIAQLSQANTKESHQKMKEELSFYCKRSHQPRRI
jgi:membrane fusion protein (multidrug efflux system)